VSTQDGHQEVHTVDKHVNSNSGDGNSGDGDDSLEDLNRQIQHFATKEDRINEVIAGTSKQQQLRRQAREVELRERQGHRQARDQERMAERERRRAEREAKSKKASR
jgi:hypothetical protein